jgi:hypothetical protein
MVEGAGVVDARFSSDVARGMMADSSRAAPSTPMVWRGWPRQPRQSPRPRPLQPAGCGGRTGRCQGLEGGGGSENEKHGRAWERMAGGDGDTHG